MYVCVCIYWYIYLCVCWCVYACVCVCTYVSLNVCINVYCGCVYMCIYLYSFVFLSIYLYMYNGKCLSILIDNYTIFLMCMYLACMYSYLEKNTLYIPFGRLNDFHFLIFKLFIYNLLYLYLYWVHQYFSLIYISVSPIQHQLNIDLLI